jgi:hypothetical protein
MAGVLPNRVATAAIVADSSCFTSRWLPNGRSLGTSASGVTRVPIEDATQSIVAAADRQVPTGTASCQSHGVCECRMFVVKSGYRFGRRVPQHFPAIVADGADAIDGRVLCLIHRFHLWHGARDFWPDSRARTSPARTLCCPPARRTFLTAPWEPSSPLPAGPSDFAAVTDPVPCITHSDPQTAPGIVLGPTRVARQW